MGRDYGPAFVTYRFEPLSTRYTAIFGKRVVRLITAAVPNLNDRVGREFLIRSKATEQSI